MELYYKDLISEDASLENLVDNLTLIVQGADELARAAGLNSSDPRTAEIATRLQRLKTTCGRVRKQALAGAAATDKLLRRYPYSSLGFAFALGVIATVALMKRRN
ncbi:MAG: hypothetical protein QOJ40_2535 [Verrucomicrobiota bacterium]